MGKYLSLVREVAHETQANEHQCLAYCWTRPIYTPEDGADGPVFVQGIEVYVYCVCTTVFGLAKLRPLSRVCRYRNPEALAVIHRSSKPYLKMREVITSTALITFPQGGVPLFEPVGSGFLTRTGATESVSPGNVFVFIQYTARCCKSLAAFLAEEKILCSEIRAAEAVQALWCFVPEHREVEIPVTLFVRLLDASSYDELEATLLSFE